MHEHLPRRRRRLLPALALAPVLALAPLPAIAAPNAASPATSASAAASAPAVPADVEFTAWASFGDVDLNWNTSTPEAVTGWVVSHSSGTPTFRAPADATGHTFPDVAAGQHTYHLQPVLTDGSLGDVTSVQIDVEPYVPRPTGFRAVNDGADVVLFWNANPQATGWILSQGWNDEYLPGSATSHRITGLEPGEHSFHLSMRVGTQHGRSVEATVEVPDLSDPTSTPGAPTGFTAALSGENAANLAWAAPTDTGGGLITGYRVTAGGKTVTLDADVTGHHVDGLALGARAEFTVQAINKLGAGQSATTHLDVPALVPFAPVDLDARVDGTDVTLTWAPASRDSGAPVTGWKVTSSRGSWTLPADARSHRFTSLPRGVAHTLTVAAINGVGEGATSTITTPAASPASAPRDLAFVQAGDYRSATWKAPANDGGSDVIGYDVTVNGQTTRISGGSTLANLNAYRNPTHLTITVAAVTSAGTGTAATLATKVLRTVPAAPRITGLWALDGAPTIHWAQGDPTFDPALTGYTVVLPDGRRVDLGKDVTRYAITDQIGANRTVQVIARSATGNSPAASRTHNFGHRTPGAPRNLKVAWNRNDATLTWADPAAAHGHAFLNWTITADGRTFTTSRTTKLVVKDLPRTATKFTITAKGNKGGGSGAAASISSKPAVYTPDVPRKVDVSHKDKTLTVTWKAPKDDGGKKIKHYLIHLNGKQKAKPKASATKHSFKNLAPGKPIKIEIRAVTDKGKGLIVKTEYTIPGKPPKPQHPRTWSFFGHSITFDWQAPSHFAGSKHKGYEVQWERKFNAKWHGGYNYTEHGMSVGPKTVSISPRTEKGEYRMRVRTVTEYGKSDWTKWTKWEKRK